MSNKAHRFIIVYQVALFRCVFFYHTKVIYLFQVVYVDYQQKLYVSHPSIMIKNYELIIY